MINIQWSWITLNHSPFIKRFKINQRYGIFNSEERSLWNSSGMGKYCTASESQSRTFQPRLSDSVMHHSYLP